MMKRKDEGAPTSVEHVHVEMLGLLHEPVPRQQWVSSRQHKTWRPPTDVYETDEYAVVKVEIAGMEEEDFSISLDSRVLTISGVRRDPAAKLAYQQMEILYGQFETCTQLPWAIDQDRIEAVYEDGFLNVFLPKAKPRQVPVVSTEDSP